MKQEQIGIQNCGGILKHFLWKENDLWFVFFLVFNS